MVNILAQISLFKPTTLSSRLMSRVESHVYLSTRVHFSLKCFISLILCCVTSVCFSTADLISHSRNLILNCFGSSIFILLNMCRVTHVEPRFTPVFHCNFSLKLSISHLQDRICKIVAGDVDFAELLFNC